jgi:hypothetical protein
MHKQITSTTGVSVSPAINLLPSTAFAVGFGAIVTGTATYTIQHTFDGVNYFDHEFVVGATTSQDGNYAYPVASIRVNVTSGTGTVILTTISNAR